MEKCELEEKVNDGLSIAQIAEYFKKGHATIRYWLKKYSLRTDRSISLRRTWSDEALIEAVKNSISIRQIIIKLGLSPRPGNYPTIKKRIKELNINIDHLLGVSHGTGGHR